MRNPKQLLALCLLCCLLPAACLAETAYVARDKMLGNPTPEDKIVYAHQAAEQVEALFDSPRTQPWEIQALLAALLAYAPDGTANFSGYIPRPGDITDDEATAIARAALAEKYGLTGEWLDALPAYPHYYDNSVGGESCWQVTIGINKLGYELYYVTIYAASGEVIDASLNTGNG